MSDSPLFKRAFVRGLNAELMRQGVVHFPTKEAADQSADFIADNYCPDPLENGNAITLKVAHALCDQLHAAGAHLCKEAGNRYQPALNKTAAAADPAELALTEAWQVMEKSAMETGSIYDGGDVANDMPAAAAHNGEAAQEQMRRPENYANNGEDGVGASENAGKGMVGTEEPHPKAPKATDSGANSAIDHSKAASLVAAMRKAAEMGSIMTPGSATNDMPAAAAHNGEAAQEMARRPENYANKGESGVGKTDMSVPPAAQVGTEQPHPQAPTKTAFDVLFEETAKDLINYLPENASDESKVAHIRNAMGLDTEKRAHYLHTLWNEIAPSNANEIAAHYVKSAKEDEKSDKEDEKSDKEDDKSEKLPPALKKNKFPEDKDGDGEVGEESMPEKKEAALSSLQMKIAALASR